MQCIFPHNNNKKKKRSMIKSQKYLYQICDNVLINKWQVICIYGTSHRIIQNLAEKSMKMLNGPCQEWQMCSLRDPLETCPSLESMVQTNYSYELSSHSISNTRPGFFPGPGIRRWGPRRTTNVQRGFSELLCRTSFWVLRNQSTCKLKEVSCFCNRRSLDARLCQGNLSFQ